MGRCELAFKTNNKLVVCAGLFVCSFRETVELLSFMSAYKMRYQMQLKVDVVYQWENVSY